MARRMSDAASLPFFEKAQEGLVRHFQLQHFRPGQAHVVDAVLSGRNVVVVMPTGAGKSLCYQLPATLLPGVTLVISPLIALMKDQVEGLTGRGIPSTYINSSLSDSDRSSRLREMREGRYKLIYVAPERFRSSAFMDVLSQVKVDLLAIDEAHCISQWGHDFRPDYALLGQVRKRLRPPRTVALTATATPEVRADIVRVLLMKDPQVFVAGFDRENLSLEVVPVSGDEERKDEAEVLAEEGSGVVYCSTRKSAEGMHRDLLGRGVQSVLYHAGMNEKERHDAQDKFMASEKAVAVATNAFGMGIDKPNIRFVAHANMPRAVEAYYQEIGRAGRDGKPAKAVLLFNHADVYTQERLIQLSHPPEVVFRDVWNALWKEEAHQLGIANLAAQVGASEQEVSSVLRLFERHGKLERNAPHRNELGITLRPSALSAEAESGPTRALLSTLKEMGSPGKSLSVDVNELAERTLMSVEKVRKALSTLEKAKHLQQRKPFAAQELRALVKVPYADLGFRLDAVRAQEKQAMLLLRRMTDYAYAKDCRRSFLIGYFGEEVSADNCGNCDVCLKTVRKREVKLVTKESVMAGAHSELAVMELKKWRRELSKDLDMPPFLLFNDATLYALATTLPVTREEFLRVKGAGESKWERFGSKIVEVSRLARAAGHVPMASTSLPKKVRKRATI